MVDGLAYALIVARMVSYSDWMGQEFEPEWVLLDATACVRVNTDPHATGGTQTVSTDLPNTPNRKSLSRFVKFPVSIPTSPLRNLRMGDDLT